MWPMIVVLVSAIAIVFATVCVGATVLSVVLWWQTRREWRDRPESDGDDGAGNGDGDGNLPRTPQSPSSGGDGAQPWWPDFERDFAAYVARRRAGQNRV